MLGANVSLQSGICNGIGSNTYVSTYGRTVDLPKLKQSHLQKSHLRLTNQAKEYIDNLFDKLVLKHGK